MAAMRDFRIVVASAWCESASCVSLRPWQTSRAGAIPASRSTENRCLSNERVSANLRQTAGRVVELADTQDLGLPFFPFYGLSSGYRYINGTLVDIAQNVISVFKSEPLVPRLKVAQKVAQQSGSRVGQYSGFIPDMANAGTVPDMCSSSPGTQIAKEDCLSIRPSSYGSDKPLRVGVHAVGLPI